MKRQQEKIIKKWKIQFLTNGPEKNSPAMPLFELVAVKNVYKPYLTDLIDTIGRYTDIGGKPNSFNYF